MEYEKNIDQFCKVSDTITKQERIIDLELKKLQLKEAMLRLESWEEQYIIIDKIYCLHNLLTGITIDEEKTVFNSEPILKPIYSTHETQIIKQKILFLLKNF